MRTKNTEAAPGDENVSQRKLADMLQVQGLDIDKNAIQRMESGKRFITDIELKALARSSKSPTRSFWIKGIPSVFWFRSLLPDPTALLRLPVGPGITQYHLDPFQVPVGPEDIGAQNMRAFFDQPFPPLYDLLILLPLQDQKLLHRQIQHTSQDQEIYPEKGEPSLSAICKQTGDCPAPAPPAHPGL